MSSFCTVKEPATRIRRMHFFGFDEQKEIVDDGMNAKMTKMAAEENLSTAVFLSVAT